MLTLGTCVHLVWVLLRLSTSLNFSTRSLEFWVPYCSVIRRTRKKPEYIGSEPRGLRPSGLCGLCLFFSDVWDRFPCPFPVRSLRLVKICYWWDAVGLWRLFWHRGWGGCVRFRLTPSGLKVGPLRWCSTESGQWWWWWWRPHHSVFRLFSRPWE